MQNRSLALLLYTQERFSHPKSVRICRDTADFLFNCLVQFDLWCWNAASVGSETKGITYSEWWWEIGKMRGCKNHLWWYKIRVRQSKAHDTKVVGQLVYEKRCNILRYDKCHCSTGKLSNFFRTTLFNMSSLLALVTSQLIFNTGSTPIRYG